LTVRGAGGDGVGSLQQVFRFRISDCGLRIGAVLGATANLLAVLLSVSNLLWVVMLRLRSATNRKVKSAEHCWTSPPRRIQSNQQWHPARSNCSELSKFQVPTVSGFKQLFRIRPSYFWTVVSKAWQRFLPLFAIDGQNSPRGFGHLCANRRRAYRYVHLDVALCRHTGSAVIPTGGRRHAGG
jgi:hypothetical protein